MEGKARELGREVATIFDTTGKEDSSQYRAMTYRQLADYAVRGSGKSSLRRVDMVDFVFKDWGLDRFESEFVLLLVGRLLKDQPCGCSVCNLDGVEQRLRSECSETGFDD